jgi:hypothetical protein
MEGYGRVHANTLKAKTLANPINPYSANIISAPSDKTAYKSCSASLLFMLMHITQPHAPLCA